METTEHSDIVQNAIIDANIQSSDFSNELYEKMESDISFEGTVKNNSSNGDQEIPYEMNAENLGLNNLNGAPTYTNDESVKKSEKTEDQETVEQSGTGLVTNETDAPVPSFSDAEHNALVDEILGETSQPLEESTASETTERLLAHNEKEHAEKCVIDEKQQTETSVDSEPVVSKLTDNTESVSNCAGEAPEKPQTIEAAFIEEENISQNRENEEYVVEEPANDLIDSTAESNVKDVVDIQETETIMIEEISADGSVSSTSNPPVILTPEEQENEEKAEENEETDKKVELLESVVIYDVEEKSNEENTVVIEDVEGTATVVITDENAENSLVGEHVEIPENNENVETEQEKTDMEKQIEEAPIILEQDTEHIGENVIFIEGTEILEERESEVKTVKLSEDTEKPKINAALEKMKIPHHVLGNNHFSYAID